MAKHKVTFLPLNVTVEVDDAEYPLADHGRPGSLLDIALALVEAHPEVDPLTVRFTDLHRWVVALPGFADDPKTSNEGILESIQMKWLEEHRDR